MNNDTKDRIASPRPFSPTVRLAAAQMEQTRVEAQGIIKGHMIGAMSVGMLPIPIVDGIALTNIQWNLICRLADHYGVPVQSVYRTMFISMIGGSLPVLFSGVGGSFLKLIPGFGQIASSIALSNLAAASTFAAGKVFMEHFERGGTMSDFRPRSLRRQFRLELGRSRRSSAASQ